MMNDRRRYSGPNAAFVLDLYDDYLRDPASVAPEVRAEFDAYGPPLIDDDELTASAPAAWPAPVAAVAAPVVAPIPVPVAAPAPAAAPALPVQTVLGAAALARAIRAKGHLAAHLDPLAAPPAVDPSLEPAAHGVTEADLAALPAAVAGGPVARQAHNAAEAIAALRRVYQGVTGYEFDHIADDAERQWLHEAVESGHFHQPLGHAAQRALLERLTLIDTFERVMHQAFPGQTRFSIEGLDMLVPMLDEVVKLTARAGGDEVMLGMAHRGRLNMLAHVMGKTYKDILSEFRRAGQSPAFAEEDLGAWMGDVKYHLDGRNMIEVEGRTFAVAMAPNPSHLEYINPVVNGMVRAAQDDRRSPGRPVQDVNKSLAVQIHGDAAFPGQGIVTETLNMGGLEGYTVGGSLHIIGNNQIGFSTPPEAGRTGRYSSDVAKGYGIPIVHVNADEPEACLAAVQLAHAYRQQFHKDFLIDLVGYRRWGHNEGDEPMYTQPALYEVVNTHTRVRDLWAQRVVAAGVVTQDEAEAMASAINDQLQEVRAEAARAGEAHGHIELKSVQLHEGIATAVPAAVLTRLNDEWMTFPDGFVPNPRTARQLERRRTALGPDGGIEWGHAETLAFASILANGTPIRLTGQDTERGTFSHRHAVLHSATDEQFTPLQSLPGGRAAFDVHNSPLSENATVAFEFGYGVTAPETLVLWEAQYGDFANGAQVVIDQFLTSARSKWGVAPALVLLLPHGYEGAGPEHSSARLERFLQMAADDNLRVANCSTASQYFHLLRRQAALLELDPRPLIVMTPKSLLRLPRASARLEDLADGSFHTVIDDAVARERARQITRVVLCSGKVYYDLTGAEARAAADGAAVVRVEELYPFPAQDLARVLQGYPNLREVTWAQEEPKNMGAWTYIAPRLRDLVGRDVDVAYVGRPDRASPAEGSAARHAVEQARIVRAAFAGVSSPQKGSRRESHAG